MGKGGGGRGVGQVVSRDVDGLHRGDRAVLRGSDTLLQLAHLVGQGGLIAHGGGHTAQQSGDLTACLQITEDVIDEQQHVLMLLIAEVLRHGQTAHSHAHTGSGGLVHLTEDQRGLFDYAGLVHLGPEVVALAGTLSDAGEDGIAAVLREPRCVISSWISTVLPTPAPPNRPILPPLA